MTAPPLNFAPNARTLPKCHTLLTHFPILLTDLFTVDNTTKTSSKLIQYPGEITTGCYNVQYRFMRGPTVNIAYKMIHNIAIGLGYKQAVLFLDECIADLYEILSRRISHERVLFNLEHSRFIEKYFGLAVIAKEVSEISSVIVLQVAT